MLISIVIPAYHEEDYLPSCIASIEIAKESCPCDVEIYIAKDIKGIGRARNIGAANTAGDILVFLDADCIMSPSFLQEVYEKSQIWENMGGGTKWVKFDRYTIGRILALIPTAIWLYWHQVTFGPFWIKRRWFELLDGFIEDDDVHLDSNFAVRLKKLAYCSGMKFRSLKKGFVVWSTRGFDKYGEWFWLKRYRIFKE